MKKALLIAVLFSVSASAQTNVSGFINANTTWNLAGAPYIITGNTLLSSGYTLTIDPGVVVKFDDSCALQIDGELHAIGTANQRITFTSNQPVPALGDWAKIHFADTCVNAVFDASGNYLSGCVMKYCDVMYGGELGFGEIHVIGSSPYFNNCKVINSSKAGIYMDNAYLTTTFFLDSSSVKNCSDFGVYLSSVSPNLRIEADSIENNLNGGIYFGSVGNDSKILGNFFYANQIHGAIFSSNVVNMLIEENNFINNMSQSPWGIIHINYASSFTIQCNRFMGNISARGAIFASAYSSYIRYNIFDGNTSPNGASVMEIDVGAPGFLYIMNNIIRGNTSIGSCCVFKPRYVIDGPFFHVEKNEFVNNSGLSIIKIESLWSITNSGYNCLYFKNNNFLDQGVELYNSVPYGSPNIYADSNYWGSTSTQHVDSIIYDYFDDANKSVVYYSPVLTVPAVIDTVCPLLVTAINEDVTQTNYSFSLFPNPFSAHATAHFGKEVHNATFSLYNLLGEKVKTISGINGESLQIDRGNLQSGVYIFEVMERGSKIGRGKAVIY